MFFSFSCEAAGIGGFDGDVSKTASVAVKSRACASTTGILPVFLPFPQKAAKFRGATFGTHRRDRFYSRHYWKPSVRLLEGEVNCTSRLLRARRLERKTRAIGAIGI